MARIIWDDSTLTTSGVEVFSTGAGITSIEALTSGSSALSVAYDNGAAGTLDLYADFHLQVSYAGVASITTGDKVADLYLLPSVDDTNFAATGNTLPQKLLLIGSFETVAPATGSYEFLMLPGIPLPARNMLFLIQNTSVETLGSCGNVLLMKPYTIQTSGT